MKIVTIIGARPQFVKAGIVSLKLKKYPSVKEVIIHTGQHFDENMSDIFFRELDIPEPKYNLNINNVGHGAMTGRMLESLEDILIKEKPDYCMVYGDTNSTLAGALAAKKLHINVIHVEAGLRSFNMKMPEEINRILTDRISDILFCPTTTATGNLEKEGFNHFSSKIYLSGDVMEDAALYFYQKTSLSYKNIDLPIKPYTLVTIHRAENTDNIQNLRNIMSVLNQLSEKNTIVLPLHPRTKKILRDSGIQLNFSPIEPVGYLQMLHLIKNASLVLTDSGGLQKEAFFFRKYCITLREETEWTELVVNGYNHLAGSDPGLITALSLKYFNKEIKDPKNLYGNGKAAEFICKTLSEL
jgi:UDP-GlcNAc3NAcA epimerase